jgi:Kelch motif
MNMPSSIRFGRLALRINSAKVRLGLGAIAASVLVLLPIVSEAIGNTWVPVASMPAPRTFAAAAAGTNGLIYVVGGENPVGTPLDINQAYSASSNTWTTLQHMNVPRIAPGAVGATNGLIYVMGGLSAIVPSPVFENSLEAYNPATDTWATQAPMPTARDSLGAAQASNGLIYAVGGFDGTNVLATVESYNITTNSWSTAPPLNVARRDLGVAAGLDGRIYAAGGSTVTEVPLSTFERFDPATNSWTTLPPMPTARTRLALVTGVDGHIYAIGGDDGTTALSTVEAFDPVSNTWSTVASLPAPRTALAGADGAIFAIGGSDTLAGGFPTNTLATNDAYTVAIGHLTLTKQASPTQGAASLSGTYTYTVTNDGNDPITNLTVNDNTCSPAVQRSGASPLNPGQVATFTCTTTFGNAGTFTNTATAQGVDSVTGLTITSDPAQSTVNVALPNTGDGSMAG